MDREQLVLAALAPANGDIYTPVQIQKLLFLLDRNIPNIIGGPHFDFEPYDYGPFDKEVYSVLHQLESVGMVEIVEESGRNWKQYRLTQEGQESGNTILLSIDEKGRDYIQKISEFVRSLTFAELVTAIYKAFPDMKANSIFGN